MSNQHHSRHRDSPSQTSSSRYGQYQPTQDSRHHSSSSRTESGESPSSRHSRQGRSLQTVAEMTKDPNQTERPPTPLAQLGDPNRTILEGFEPPNSSAGSRQESSRGERNSRPGGNSRPGNSRPGNSRPGNSRPGGSIRQESSRSERNGLPQGNSRPRGSIRQESSRSERNSGPDYPRPDPPGSVQASEYGRSNTKSQPAAAMPPAFVSRAPSHAKSLFVDNNDAKMAARQNRYDNMTLEERMKQDEWVQIFLVRATPCPIGFGWQRIEGKGYHCHCRSHLVTDELICEGKGGIMYCRYGNPWFPPIGPYYEIPGALGWWKYAGPEPRWPDVKDVLRFGFEHHRGFSRNPGELTQEQREYLLRMNGMHKAQGENFQKMSTSEQQALFDPLNPNHQYAWEKLWDLTPASRYSGRKTKRDSHSYRGYRGSGGRGRRMPFMFNFIG